VTDEKKDFLERIGDVYAPFIDYEKQADIVIKLYEEFRNKPLDFISGTSLGGIIAFHLAKLLNVPCLLFNPAVIALNQIKQFIPNKAFETDYKQNSMVVIGLKDDIVDPNLQIEFFKNFKNFILIKETELEHGIPIEIFEEYFNEFFEKIF